MSYHQFAVADAGCHMSEYGRPVKGVAAVDRGVVAIYTGISMGCVDLAAEVHTSPPPLHTHAWDDVVEVSFQAPGGRVVVTGIGADGPGTLPLLTPAGPGTYRLRVHVRGRDTAVDQVRREPTEEYLLQIWPGVDQPDAALRLSDAYGSIRRSVEVPPPTPPPPDPERVAREENLRRASSSETP